MYTYICLLFVFQFFVRSNLLTWQDFLNGAHRNDYFLSESVTSYDELRNLSLPFIVSVIWDANFFIHTQTHTILSFFFSLFFVGISSFVNMKNQIKRKHFWVCVCVCSCLRMSLSLSPKSKMEYKVIRRWMW